jgi:hypothetical protein
MEWIRRLMADTAIRSTPTSIQSPWRIWSPAFASVGQQGGHQSLQCYNTDVQLRKLGVAQRACVAGFRNTDFEMRRTGHRRAALVFPAGQGLLGQLLRLQIGRLFTWHPGSSAFLSSRGGLQIIVVDHDSQSRSTH